MHSVARSCAQPGFVELAGHPILGGELVRDIHRDTTTGLAGHPILGGELVIDRRQLQLVTGGAAAYGGAENGSVTSSVSSSSVVVVVSSSSSSSSSSISSSNAVARDALGLRMLMSRALKGDDSDSWRERHSEAPWDTGIACNPVADKDTCAVATGGPGGRCAYFQRTPNEGLMSFDNVGLAFVTLLQCVTFDDWTEVMYSLMIALSPYVVLYFVAFVALGGFFVINLFLAVVFEEHSAQQAELEAQQCTQRLLTEQLAEVGALQLARERNFSDSPMKLGDSPMKLAPLEEEEEAEEAEGAAAWPRRALDLEAPAEVESEAAAMGRLGPSLPAPSATGSQAHSDEADAAQALLLPGATSSDAIVTDEEKGAAAMSLWEEQQQQFAAPDDASASCVGCAPVHGTFRYRLAEIVSSEGSGLVATVLVVINLVLMAMPYEGMSAEYAARLDDLTTTITWIFIGEMGLKLYGLGCEGYWRDGWNRLDGTIVSISIFEMVLSALFADSGMNLSFLRILRMLRVARMLRLMRSWKGLYKIISTVVSAVPQMSNVLILMFLICTIFALLGMQLFGGQFSEEHGYGDSPPLLPLPRYNFDYFGPALLSVFVLTTGGWFAPMLDGLRVGGPSAAIYYITATCIGTYILINLLIAVLLELFAEDADADGEADAFQADSGAKAAEAAIAPAPPAHLTEEGFDAYDTPIDENDDMALG